MPAGLSSPRGNTEIEPDQQTAVKNSNRPDAEMTEGLESPFPPTQAIELPTGAVECMSRALVPQDPEQKRKESVCVGLTGTKVQKGQPSRVKPCEDPLPGRLFFYLPPGQHQSDCSPLNESTAAVSLEPARLKVLLRGAVPLRKKVLQLIHMSQCQPLPWEGQYRCLRPPVGRSRRLMTFWRPGLKPSSFWSLSHTWLSCPTTFW